MSTSNNSEDTNPRKAGAKKAAGRKKGAPSHFNPSLVQGLIAGADDVAGRSFIGGGGAVTAPPPETPQADVAPAPAAPTSSAEAGTDLESSEPSVITAPRVSPPAVPSQAATDRSSTAEANATITQEVATPRAVPAPVVPADQPEPRSEPGAPDDAVAENLNVRSSDGVQDSEPEPHGSDLSGSSTHDHPASKSGGQTPKPADGPSEEAAGAGSQAPEGGKSARGSRRRPNSAHAALLESFKDARRNSKAWQGWGFRIYPDTLAALKQRMNADRRSTGLKLAIGHYVDAALRSAPSDVSEMIKIADEYDDERVFDNDTTRPSTYRVGASAYSIASSLKMTMDEADESRRGAAFVSAAVQRLLDGLDAGGILNLPTRSTR